VRQIAREASATVDRAPIEPLCCAGKEKIFGNKNVRADAVKSLLTFVGVLVGVCTIAIPPAMGQSLAITHVTVIDTTDGAFLRDRTVVVHDGRIAEVQGAPGLVPPGTTLVSGRGKFLMPGLWDMETHLSWVRSCALPILVANGVTGVRDMGGNLTETAEWAQQISAGALIGPTILQVGPMLSVLPVRVRRPGRLARWG
jgi:hypothetical protein